MSISPYKLYIKRYYTYFILNVLSKNVQDKIKLTYHGKVLNFYKLLKFAWNVNKEHALQIIESR
jgi:hypothetical protein